MGSGSDSGGPGSGSGGPGGGFSSVDKVTRMKKNEFGLGILIKGTKKTSLVQGFSLKWDFILEILMTRMKRDYQDDSSFSSWYPIKPALLFLLCLLLGYIGPFNWLCTPPHPLIRKSLVTNASLEPVRKTN